MTALRLIAGGRPLLLGPRIGRGGEGEIHALGDGSGRAVKLHFQPDAAREAKVRAMIASQAAAACPDVAFPQDVVRHADGRFAGFLMAQVTDHQPIHELIGASSRRQFFPHADFRFLVRVALNLARVVSSIHAAGIVVGDLNSSGILVSQRGTVKLIDADSFQISSHRCRVGMPEYTPPEMQGVPFGSVDRTTNHDAFGLAAMVFQILMLGRHPFAGVSRGRQIALDQAIRSGRFAFSQLADVGIASPPNSLTLGDLPRAIRHQFERAFLLVGSIRPSAADWVSALSDLETSLIACPVRADHVMAPVSMRCPWCRIERATGRPMFASRKATPTLPADPLFERLRADVATAVHRAKRQAGEGIEPPWHERRLKPSKAAMAYVGGGKSSSQGIDAAELVGRRRDATIAAERALMRWRTSIGVWDVLRSSDEVRAAFANFERLRSRRPFLLGIALTQSVDDQVNHILAGRSLKDGRIPGVGDALIARLARHGIVSAADLARDRLLSISGVGEKRIVALLFWRESLAVSVERDVRRSAQCLKAARLDAVMKADRRIALFERHVRSGIADLNTAADLVHTRASHEDATLADLLRARDQALADLSLFGSTSAALSPSSIALKPAASSPASKGRKVKKGAGKAKAQKTCPSCGAPMVKRWGGTTKGKAFHYGCSAYPRCSGVRAIPVKGGRP